MEIRNPLTPEQQELVIKMYNDGESPESIQLHFKNKLGVATSRYSLRKVLTFSPMVKLRSKVETIHSFKINPVRTRVRNGKLSHIK